MNDIRPLKDIAEISEKFPILPVLILILAALATIAFIYFRKNKKVEEKSFKPSKPPEEIAREALKALKEMKLIEKGLIKEYYIRLSDVIRAYIENRYRIFAMDRTTWELFQEMKLKKIERLHADEINDLLEDDASLEKWFHKEKITTKHYCPICKEYIGEMITIHPIY